MNGRTVGGVFHVEPTILLRRVGLKRTVARLSLLRLLQEVPGGLVESTLPERLPRLDPLTLQRTIDTFLAHRLAHRLVGTEARLLPTLWGQEADHTHAICRSCGAVTCLPPAARPSLPLPFGFVLEGHQTVLIGRCAPCSTEAELG